MNLTVDSVETAVMTHTLEPPEMAAVPAATDLRYQLTLRVGPRQHHGVHGGQRTAGRKANPFGTDLAA